MNPSTPMSPNYRIELEGLSFRAPWGVSDSERTDGCSVTIDIVLSVTGDAPESDRLADTVNYVEVADIASAIAMEGGNLIEYLANEIANRCLEDFPAVDWVEVSVRKAPAPMPIEHRSMGVKVVKTRPGDPDESE